MAPGHVEQQLNDSNYILKQTLRSCPFLVHVDRMKSYYGELPATGHRLCLPFLPQVTFQLDQLHVCCQQCPLRQPCPPRSHLCCDFRTICACHAIHIHHATKAASIPKQVSPCSMLHSFCHTMTHDQTLPTVQCERGKFAHDVKNGNN